jgi:ferredoxin
LTGYSDINFVVAPAVQHRLASFIEDHGYEATTILYRSGRLGNATGKPALRKDGAEKPKPNIFFDFRIAGQLCGVGQIGYNRLLLTPRFGPSQRIFFLVTDAPLEADPLITEQICDGCQECVRHCPAKALYADKHDDIDVKGVTYIKRSAINVPKCAVAHRAGALSPFAPDEIKEYALKIINGTDTHTTEGKPMPTGEEITQNFTNKVAYAKSALEVFRGASVLCAECMRTCLAHLDKVDRLTLKFHNAFRD